MSTLPATIESPILDRYRLFLAQEALFNLEQLAQTPNFYLHKMDDDSMLQASIPKHALLLVDLNQHPQHNQIVLAEIDGRLTVKRLIVNSSGKRLMPAHQKESPIPITASGNVRLKGTVVKILIDAQTL